MKTDFDIAICGAGPVGLLLATLLVKRGVPAERVGVIDGKTLAVSIADPRTIALSHGSRQLLDQVGAWPAEFDPIHEIHVSRRGQFGRTLMRSTELGVPALGYVCRYGALVESLAARASDAGIKVQRPQQIIRTDESDEQIAIMAESGCNWTSALLVQAEGGLFGDQTERPLRRDYQQTAIVAHVKCSMAKSGRAFERFTESGPLALLPQQDGYALVWCLQPERALGLMAQDDAQFLSALQQSFGERVGEFTSVGKRNAFALGLNAGPSQTRRSIAIGNAAQTLHPVAGQGLNLGLRDAAVLADLLARDASPQALASFGSARSTDRRLTVGITDAMARLFTSINDRDPTQTLLGASLGLIDLFQPAKRMLAGQMMFGWR